MLLKGMTVILTRPDEELAAKLNSEGAVAKIFPVFRFRSIPSSRHIVAVDADLVIFSSPQAVIYGFSGLQMTAKTRLAAPGEGTARQLRALTSRPVITPHEGAGLRSLLDAPELQDIGKWSVLFVCGKTGSQHSMALLEEYARSIENLFVYSREFNPIDSTVRNWFESAKVNVIMVSSAGAVNYLAKALGGLFQTQSWLASSGRVACSIRAQGGNVVAIAESAEVEAMVAAARNFWMNRGG